MSEYAQISGTGGEDDLALIKLVLAGDRRAFEPLVRKHERRVFRVTLTVLGNVEDAEEAMQDEFIKAYRHLDQFRGESRFTTWLTKIAVNEALQKRHAKTPFLWMNHLTWGAERFHDGLSPGLPTPKSCTANKRFASLLREP
jgi:DNA-directed RNA polymerase specialized sigma24 family protein